MYRVLAVCIVVLGLTGTAHGQDAGSGPGSGVGVASPVITPTPSGPLPSDSLSNPASEPVAAWDDAVAARKIGWTALVFAVATMVAMGIGTLGKNMKQLAWLNRGKTAVVAGAVVAVGAAGFDVAAQGGSYVALLLALWSAGLAYYNSYREPKVTA